MTNQEAFTKMVRHLRKQGKPSFLEDEATCAYRGEKGRMCAVGCLIPDEQYHTSMEGQPANMIYAPALVGLDHELLLAVQRIHDGRPPSQWEKNLAQCAFDFRLEMPDAD